MRTFLALIAASIAPALVVVPLYLAGQFAMFPSDDPYIWVRTRTFAVISLAVSAAHVFFLGLPAMLLLRRFSVIRLRNTLVCGFVLAMIPMGFISFPLQYEGYGSSSTVNGVQMMVDGVTTAAGWIDFVQGMLFAGCFGLLAAGAFWLVWRKSPNNSLKRTDQSLRD